MKKGKVWLVGAGPSDPGLFTLKGKQVLEAADVVVYDRLVGGAVLDMIPAGAERVDVGKTAGTHPVPQNEINEILLAQAREGKAVVRLKGGDPFVFGRGGEELELLAEHGIPFEVVPGVTSAVAVPAYAGIPVTHRDFCSSVHIITGHGKKGSETAIPYKALAQLNGTLVFLMGTGALKEICGGLVEAGMDRKTPAAILERGTTACQRRVTGDIGTLYEKAAEADIKPPAVIVVGRVCALSKTMHWAEDRPLGGVRVVNVRPQERSARLSRMLYENGAEVIEFPCIRTEEIVRNAPFDAALDSIGDYDWVAFTSPYGAELFFQRLRRRGMDIRTLAGVRFAAIGSATVRKISEYGIMADYVPKSYNVRALGEGLREIAAGMRLLALRAREGSNELGEALGGRVELDDVPIYETIRGLPHHSAAAKAVENGAFDYVMFTSASTVRGFYEAVKGIDFTAVHAVCIGSETEKQARSYGMDTAAAEHATLESMVEKLAGIVKAART